STVYECPHVRICVAQLRFDLDVAALVLGDAGALKAEIVGVRDAPHREEDMRPIDPRFAVFAIDADGDPPRLGFQADALCAGADRDPLGPENLLYRLRH